MLGRTRKHGSFTRGVCTYSHQHSSIVIKFVDCTFSHQHRRSASPFWVLKLEPIGDQYPLASPYTFRRVVFSATPPGSAGVWAGGSLPEMKEGRRSLFVGENRSGCDCERRPIVAPRCGIVGQPKNASELVQDFSAISLLIECRGLVSLIALSRLVALWSPAPRFPSSPGVFG